MGQTEAVLGARFTTDLSPLGWCGEEELPRAELHIAEPAGIRPAAHSTTVLVKFLGTSALHCSAVCAGWSQGTRKQS